MTAAVAGAARTAAARPVATGAGRSAVPASTPAQRPAAPPAKATSAPPATSSGGSGGGGGSVLKQYGPGSAVQRVTGKRPWWSRGGKRETVGQSAAGAVLALLAWGWIVLPLIEGGPKQVKATLMAKFLNKSPDGTWLP